MDFSISSSIFVLFTLVTILGGASIFFVFKKNLNDNFWEVIFFSSCLGLSFDIVSILILGFFKILYLKFFLCFQAIKLIILVISYSKIINYIREYKFNFCISLLFIISCILVSFHPAGGWDDTMYHLPAIRYYIENKGFEVAYFLRFPLFPQNIDILFCIPGLIFGANSILFEYFTQMQSTFCIIVTIFGVLAASKHFTDSYIYGSISALLMFSVITVVWYNGLAYIDNGVMLFCFAATLCLAMYIDSHKYFYFIIDLN